jgi:hypothetical protein
MGGPLSPPAVNTLAEYAATQAAAQPTGSGPVLSDS